VAGKQIRNVAAVGGNIMSSYPIPDLNPILMAAGALLRVQSAAGGPEPVQSAASSTERLITFDANFYTGYRRTVLRPEEVLVSISIPFPASPDQFFVAFKQARRRDDDIAIVNAAFNVTVVRSDDDKLHIGALRMAFGGMAATTVLAEKTAGQLIGKEIGKDGDSIVETACGLLTEELALGAGAPGAMIRYRQSLVLSFFFKFYLELRRDLGLALSDSEVSATERFEKAELHSHQLFEIKPTSTPSSALGQPIKHKAADYQVAGTAQYTDDMARREGELYMGLVLSKRAHARILKVDASTALAMEGVREYVDHRDVEGSNSFSIAILKDELVFAVDEVFCQVLLARQF